MFLALRELLIGKRSLILVLKKQYCGTVIVFETQLSNPEFSCKLFKPWFGVCVTVCAAVQLGSVASTLNINVPPYRIYSVACQR